MRHVSNTNRYRQPDGDDDAAFCARLLAEIEAVIQEEGPETIAMLSAEPIQNAGGCYTPPDGLLAGAARDLADRYGFLLHADEVISGFGRLGEYYGVTRYGGVPDVITLAKGLTSGHVPMGAVMLSERIMDVLREPGCTLMHGLTFGGHPVCAAVAIKSIEIYEREGVLERVRSRTPFLGELMEALLAIPAVGDVRGDGYFWAAEIVADEEGSPADRRREGALRQRGHAAAPAEQRLIARGDGRGDAVVQIAPILVAEDAIIEEIVERLGRAIEGMATEGTPRLRATPRRRRGSHRRRRPRGSVGRVVHEVDRELVHARVAQLVSFATWAARSPRTQKRSTISSGTNSRVRVPGAAVVRVVVALARRDVVGERGGHLAVGCRSARRSRRRGCRPCRRTSGTGRARGRCRRPRRPARTRAR